MIARITLCAAVTLVATSVVAEDDPAMSVSPPAAEAARNEPDAVAPATQSDATKDEPVAGSAEEADPEIAEAEAADPRLKEVSLLVIEKNIVKFTNEERARHGLPPLKIDVELMKTARNHAIWMTRFRRLQHTRLSVAENIAVGYSDSQSVVRGWMNSSGHRANILNRTHGRIGVAAYVTDSGTIYWCQQFRR